MKKETKVQLIIIVILSIVLGILLFFIFKNNNNRNNMFIPMEEEVEKETSKDDVDNGDTINEKNINLNNYESNINITKGGESNIINIKKEYKLSFKKPISTKIKKSIKDWSVKL